MLTKYTHGRKSEFWRKVLLMSQVEKKLKILWWTGCEFYSNCKSSRENFHTYETSWEERNCDELGVTLNPNGKSSLENLFTCKTNWEDIAVGWVWTFILFSKCGNYKMINFSTTRTAWPLYSKWNRRLSENDLKRNNKRIFPWKCDFFFKNGWQKFESCIWK